MLSDQGSILHGQLSGVYGAHPPGTWEFQKGLAEEDYAPRSFLDMLGKFDFGA